MMLLFILSANLFFLNIRAQSVCNSEAGQNFPCVSLNECPPLSDILRGPKPIAEAKLSTLKSHHCGYDDRIPRVCCPLPTRTEIITESSHMILEADKNIDLPDVTNHSNLRLLDHIACGPLTDQKIYGGNETGVLNFPWMTLIAYNVRGTHEFRCGGTIINKRYILTAAHCVNDLPRGVTLGGVRVGEHDYTTERDCDRDPDGLEIVCSEGYQDFLIESHQSHSGYTSAQLHNDIALLRLNKDINFNPINVKPICLPIGTASILRHTKLTVTGWGSTEEDPISSTKLLMVNIAPVSNENCSKIYKHGKTIWNKQLCAGGEDGKDSCLGDSGGPLQAPAIYYSHPRFVQYGIVSFGPKHCGKKGLPGVYTRVSHYVDWILDHIKD